jgi:uncharacterized protein YggE
VSMKWKAAIGVVIMLAVAMVALASCSSGAALSGSTLEIKGSLSSQQEGIWVNGEGKVTAVPDVAILSVGVQAQAASVAGAQAQASGAMDKVMTALKDGGVAAKDIKTQSFNIQKMTRWDNNLQQEIVTGYSVTNTVTAKIRNVDKAGAIIDAAAAAGGDLTRVNSISFTVDDPTPYQAQARQKAVADAAAKAKQLADAAGVKLGKVVYITESSYTPVPVYLDASVKAEAAGGTPTTPITPGEMDITANVQINYSID